MDIQSTHSIYDYNLLESKYTLVEDTKVHTHVYMSTYLLQAYVVT